MGSRGGARPGAGRKAKRDQNKGAITRAEKRIRDRLPELIDNLFRLADGVTVQVTNNDGTTDVFDRPPCFKSNAYLIDRILGKPRQSVEVAGEEGGPLKVEVVYADHHPDPTAASPGPTDDPE